MLVGVARKIASDSQDFWEASQARSHPSVAFPFCVQGLILAAWDADSPLSRLAYL